MTLEEALHNNDMNDIIDSMTAYAYSRIKSIGVKDLEGNAPEDFVGEVLMKVAEGERDWQKAKCSFKDFLFGCLRSHISNYLIAFEQKYESELPDIENREESNNDSELIQIAIQKLERDGADQDEIDMFECWMDGIHKPSEVADLLEKDIQEIYNVQKRLLRKTPKLRTLIKKSI